MSKPIIIFNNVTTGEIIEREMNDIELEQHELDQKLFKEMKEEAEKKVAQRQAIAERLGLSSEELNLLLGEK